MDARNIATVVVKICLPGAHDSGKIGHIIAQKIIRIVFGIIPNHIERHHESGGNEVDHG